MYSLHHNEHLPIEKNIFIKFMHLSIQVMFLYNNMIDGINYKRLCVGYPLASDVL